MAVVAILLSVIATKLAPPVHDDTLWTLAPFVALVVAAEWMHIRFRFNGQVEALNLTESVLAPLVFAFGGPVAIVTVVIGQVIAAVVRRNAIIKSLFNVAQWACAAAVASLVLDYGAHGRSIGSRNIFALTLALVVVAIVNQLALTTVLRLAQGGTLRTVISTLSPVIVPGWMIGWGLNTLVGLLFVLAYAASPFAVLLFFVPLAVLHAAYRGYAGTESDRMRLAGLHRASRLLASPNSSGHAVASLLVEVSSCFEAGAAELLLVTDDRVEVHRVRAGDASTYVKELDRDGAGGLRSGLVRLGDTERIAVNSDHPLSIPLKRAGWRECLISVLPTTGVQRGAIVVYDQDGLEGFEVGEKAVLEALARETASSFEKGRLFAAIVEERQKLSSIVDSTYDGVVAISAEGIVRAWNPGWELITGHRGQLAIGHPLNDTITIFDTHGHEVDIEHWTSRHGVLPAEVQLVDRAGTVHFLQCSYRYESDKDGVDSVLTIVAHDMTDVREIEQLRENVDRLAELEAAQRQRVLQLQESLQPRIPDIEEAEFGVHYQPSDDTSPTGGDFYDWQVLPDGTVHIAVVDVLGSGVEATNDAFAVIHSLRLLAFQGVPIENLVRDADRLIGAHNPELVATTIVVRYDPKTGLVRLAGGGHPPPLLVHEDGRVQEVAAPGVPVGWPGAGSDCAVEVVLSASETIILYTDGLVEAQRDILQGLEALAGYAAESRSAPPTELARRLVERSLEGADRRDDSLALVVRHCGPKVASIAERFEHRGTPTLGQVPAVRHQLLSWLEHYEQLQATSADVALVVSELVTNAVRIAHSFFEVRAAVIGDDLVVEVEDDGPGFRPSALDDGLTPLNDETGRGLVIVQTLVDEMSIRPTGTGSIVRTVFQGTPIRQDQKTGPTSAIR